MKTKRILITGVAGFIGSFLAERCLKLNMDCNILGLDNLNNYYDVSIKKERLSGLIPSPKFRFEKGDISDKKTVIKIFEEFRPHIVVNLAAQAGVRYSIDNPDAYIESNLIGFYNIIEACRHSYDAGEGVQHLVFASSSSVYGANKKVPYSTEDKADWPVSLYAATKKADELMAYAYSKLYGIPATGLRFFTVYGPMGRPDMAYFKFTDKMVRGERIQIYNNGDMYRDFTYIDDIIEGILKILDSPPVGNQDSVKYRIYNIGKGKPESLKVFIETLERCLIDEGIIKEPAGKEYLPMQPGDVYQTYADVSGLNKDFGFTPKTSLATGLTQFAKWYRGYIMMQHNRRETDNV